MNRKAMTIRPMRPDEISSAVEWAAGEGWNPGFHDAACFAAVDPQGFLIGEIDGKPVAIVSTVNYDSNFSFLGFYIVRPGLRGQGYGWHIWQAGMKHAGSRVVGLDGVVAQQENYKKSGFTLAYRNIRYGGLVKPVSPSEKTVALADVSLGMIAADDATVFPAGREKFLKLWTTAPGHVGKAVVRDGKLLGWGVIRPCRKGFKIGPLIADDGRTAATLFGALTSAVGGGEIFLDVPQPNEAAIALAEDQGMIPVFETARMYTGPIPVLRLDRIFGVTTFELG
ncbi:MAG: GNAT family N-acetyltransferase [Hyphomicrobiales bacterium]